MDGGRLQLGVHLLLDAHQVPVAGQILHAFPQRGVRHRGWRYISESGLSPANDPYMPTVDLHEALTPTEAQALAEWLGHRGIATQLVPHADTAFGKLLAQGAGWGVVRVDEVDAERARQSIAEWRSLRADPEVLAEDATARPERPASERAQGRGARVLRAGWRVARPLFLATSLILNVLLFWRLRETAPPPHYRHLDADGAVIAEFFYRPGAEHPHRSVGWGKRGVTDETIDDDENGRPELFHEYGPGMRLMGTSHDADQDGYYERRTEISQGRVITAWEDRDGDTLYEQGTFQPGDRPGARWLDQDRDGAYERFELLPGPGRSMALVDSDRDGMPDRLECQGAPALPLAPLCAK